MNTPLSNRYDNMVYKRCGRSGILLPSISLGLWHNFGHVDPFATGREIVRHAFNNGITHFDLANNYGPPPGSAEENFGKILKKDFKNYRDEMVISTKAGYLMWPGPYGDRGSRKYLIASLDQSLKRLQLDYVDIFYSHCPDPDTPLEETMGVLSHAIKSGRALYAGLSNYPPGVAKKAFSILKDMGTPCLIHQPKYSMFERWAEDGLLTALEENGVGCIAFSPLAQGLLTNRYMKGIPSGSRASKEHGFLKPTAITEEILLKIRKLNDIAAKRGQSLAQMALAWVLKDNRVTSVLVGVSSTKQLEDNIKSLENLSFSRDELQAINQILNNNEKI